MNTVICTAKSPALVIETPKLGAWKPRTERDRLMNIKPQPDDGFNDDWVSIDVLSESECDLRKNDFLKLFEEKALLEKRLSEVKSETKEYWAEPCLKMTDKARLSVARDLYWNHLEIGTNCFSRLLGVHSSKMASEVGPEVFSWKCWKCGEKASQEFKSRSDLSDFDRFLSHNGGKESLSFNSAARISCEPCRGEIEAQKAKKEEAERARRSSVEYLRSIDYPSYLRSDHWQKIRIEALNAAEWACQVCNTSKAKTTLDVHHRTYERRGCEKLSDLTVLCRACHSKYHGKTSGEEKH